MHLSTITQFLQCIPELFTHELNSQQMGVLEEKTHIVFNYMPSHKGFWSYSINHAHLI